MVGFSGRFFIILYKNRLLIQICKMKNIPDRMIVLFSFCNVTQHNLFAFYKSKLRYNPVDIDIITYVLSNIIYTVLEES